MQRNLFGFIEADQIGGVPIQQSSWRQTEARSVSRFDYSTTTVDPLLSSDHEIAYTGDEVFSKPAQIFFPDIIYATNQFDQLQNSASLDYTPVHYDSQEVSDAHASNPKLILRRLAMIMDEDENLSKYIDTMEGAIAATILENTKRSFKQHALVNHRASSGTHVSWDVMAKFNHTKNPHDLRGNLTLPGIAGDHVSIATHLILGPDTHDTVRDILHHVTGSHISGDMFTKLAQHASSSNAYANYRIPLAASYIGPAGHTGIQNANPNPQQQLGLGPGLPNPVAGPGAHLPAAITRRRSFPSTRQTTGNLPGPIDRYAPMLIQEGLLVGITHGLLVEGPKKYKKMDEDEGPSGDGDDPVPPTPESPSKDNFVKRFIDKVITPSKKPPPAQTSPTDPPTTPKVGYDGHIVEDTLGVAGAAFGAEGGAVTAAGLAALGEQFGRKVDELMTYLTTNSAQANQAIQAAVVQAHQVMKAQVVDSMSSINENVELAGGQLERKNLMRYHDPTDDYRGPPKRLRQNILEKSAFIRN